MLQQESPEDYVIATGEQYSVREFVTAAAAAVGIRIEWRWQGPAEQGLDRASGRCLVAVDPRYFRPAEVDSLLGDASKARQKLGWQPRVTFAELVTEMMTHDLREAERELVCSREGFSTSAARE